MKAILAGALLWLLAAGGATAGEWYWVVSSREVVLGVDWANIRTVSGNKRVWTVTANKEVGADRYDYAVVLYEFDCDEMRQRLLSADFYEASGEPAGRGRPEDWAYPAPDSVLYGVMERVCPDDRPPGGSFETASGLAEWVRSSWEDQDRPS